MSDHILIPGCHQSAMNTFHFLANRINGYSGAYLVILNFNFFFNPRKNKCHANILHVLSSHYFCFLTNIRVSNEYFIHYLRRQANNCGVNEKDGSAEELDRETGEEQITVGWTRRKDGG